MKKVFFDTNFLLRFYLADELAQAKKAKKMVEAAVGGSLLLVTDLIVICEMVWVMESFYQMDKEDIVDKITNLYETPGIIVLNGDFLLKALIAYVERNIDFTDAIIGLSAIHHQAQYLASFDKKHMKKWADLGLKRVETPEEVV